MHAEATLDQHVEAVKQVAVADRIVMTKTDIVADGATATASSLRSRLRDINPGAAMLDATDPKTKVAELLRCGLYDPETKTADVRRWLGEEAEAHDHSGHDDRRSFTTGTTNG